MDLFDIGRYDSNDDADFDPTSIVNKKVKREARPKCCCAAFCISVRVDDCCSIETVVV